MGCLRQQADQQTLVVRGIPSCAGAPLLSTTYLCVPQVLVCLYGWLTKAPDSPLHVLKAGSTADITLTAAAADVVLSGNWQDDAKGVHIADSWDEEAAGYRAPEVNPDQPVTTCCLVAAYDAVQELMEVTWNLHSSRTETCRRGNTQDERGAVCSTQSWHE